MTVRDNSIFFIVFSGLKIHFYNYVAACCPCMELYVRSIHVVTGSGDHWQTGRIAVHLRPQNSHSSFLSLTRHPPPATLSAF